MTKTKVSVSVDSDLLRRLKGQMKRENLRSLSEAFQTYLSLGLSRRNIRTAVLLMRKSDLHILFKEYKGHRLLEHHLNFLKRNGIEKVYFITGVSEKINELIPIIDRHDIDVQFVYEEKEQGNVAALKKVEKKIDEPFLLVYGDTYFMFDIGKMAEKHFASGTLVTVGLFGDQPQKTCSVITLDGDDIKEFKKGESRDSLIIDVGLYIMGPELFSHFKAHDAMLESDVFPRLCTQGLMKGYFIYGEHKHFGPEVDYD